MTFRFIFVFAFTSSISSNPVIFTVSITKSDLGVASLLSVQEVFRPNKPKCPKVRSFSFTQPEINFGSSAINTLTFEDFFVTTNKNHKIRFVCREKTDSRVG